MSSSDRADVIVVGAGAAGIGVAVALAHLELDVRILERDGIGASFRSWPDEMRFITPSFPSNGFGLPDLNAIAPLTSPAVTLGRQQPSGDEYAEYLEAVVAHYGLSVEVGTEVTDVRAGPAGGRTDERADPVAVDGGVGADRDGTSGFAVETSDGSLHSAFVVWAGGQFGSPRRDPFPGADLCVHSATVESWADHAAASGWDEFVVIGGFESGIDAAINLVERGGSVTVLDRGRPWASDHPNPSRTLAPYTLERLDALAGEDRLSLVGGVDVERVRRRDDGRIEVAGIELDTGDERRFSARTRPILATGFEPNLGPVAALFPREDGAIRLNERDESPTTPGLFLVGPAVEHGDNEFCFVYKFRSRFPVVAETIGERLGVDTGPLEVYRESNVFLEDLSCCEPTDCGC